MPTAGRAGQRAQNGPQGPALDGRRGAPLAFRLSAGLGHERGRIGKRIALVGLYTDAGRSREVLFGQSRTKAGAQAQAEWGQPNQ